MIDLILKRPLDGLLCFDRIPCRADCDTFEVSNTVKIAEACNVELEFGNLKLPRFPLPDGFDNPDAYLEHLSQEGLRRRFAEPTSAARETATSLGLARTACHRNQSPISVAATTAAA